MVFYSNVRKGRAGDKTQPSVAALDGINMEFSITDELAAQAFKKRSIRYCDVWTFQYRNWLDRWWLDGPYGRKEQRCVSALSSRHEEYAVSRFYSMVLLDTPRKSACNIPQTDGYCYSGFQNSWISLRQNKGILANLRIPSVIWNLSTDVLLL